MILFIIYKVTVNVIVLRFYTIDRSALVVRCQCKYQCDEQSLYPEKVSARCELFNFSIASVFSAIDERTPRVC